MAKRRRSDSGAPEAFKTSDPRVAFKRALAATELRIKARVIQIASEEPARPAPKRLGTVLREVVRVELARTAADLKRRGRRPYPPHLLSVLPAVPTERERRAERMAARTERSSCVKSADDRRHMVVTSGAGGRNGIRNYSKWRKC